MATKIEFEHISAGWREVLHSAGTRALVDQIGGQLAAQCGDGYRYFPAELNYGGGRVGGFVSAASYGAQLDEAMNKTMEKAVGGGA